MSANDNGTGAVGFSRGAASSPSPRKTGAGMSPVICSIVDETPPWNKMSFLCSSFSTPFHGSPVGTGRLSLTPNLRRLCLDGSPASALERAGHHSLLAHATSYLDNESPPWDSIMEESFNAMPANRTVGSESCTGTPVDGTPVPAVLASSVDMGDEGNGLAHAAPEVSSAGKSSSVCSTHNDTSASSLHDRTAVPMNSTMDLPNGDGAMGVTSAQPAEVMNATADLESLSASHGELNKPSVPSNNTSMVDLASNITATHDHVITAAEEGNKTIEMAQDGPTPSSVLPGGTSDALSTAASLEGQLNSTVEVVSCDTSTGRMNVTLDMGNHVSSDSEKTTTVSPSGSVANSTLNLTHDSSPAVRVVQKLDNTVDLQDTPRSATPGVSMRVGTAVTLPTSVANCTMNLTQDSSPAVPVVQALDNTVDLQNTPRNSTPEVSMKVGTAATLPTSVANCTMNLTHDSSPAVPVVQTLDSTVDLQNTPRNSTPEVSMKVGTTISLSSSVSNGTVTLSHVSSPSAAMQKIDQQVNLPNTTVDGSIKVEAGTFVVNGTVNLSHACVQTAIATKQTDDTVNVEAVSGSHPCPDTPDVVKQPHADSSLSVAPTADDVPEDLNSTAESVVAKQRLSDQFSLDCSLEMQTLPPMTSTPMVTNRKLNHDPADHHARLQKMAALQGIGLPVPQAGLSGTTVVMPPPPASVAATKASELPMPRRTIPKPGSRLKTTGTAANVTVEGSAAGIQRSSRRLSLGMKTALRSAASAGSSAPPEPSQPKRPGLAPPAVVTRGKKRPNEGASKEPTAGPMQPPHASTGLKRPISDARDAPAKRPKEERVPSLSKDATPSARSLPAPAARPPAKPPAAPPARPLRAPTSRTSLQTAQARPSLGPASRLRPSLLRKPDPVLPTVPEDTTSATSIQPSALSASCVSVNSATFTQPSPASADCTITESECKNCEKLKKIIQELQEQLDKRHPQ